MLLYSATDSVGFSLVPEHVFIWASHPYAILNTQFPDAFLIKLVTFCIQLRPKRLPLELRVEQIWYTESLTSSMTRIHGKLIKPGNSLKLRFRCLVQTHMSIYIYIYIYTDFLSRQKHSKHNLLKLIKCECCLHQCCQECIYASTSLFWHWYANKSFNPENQ